MIHFITGYTENYQGLTDISLPVLKQYCLKNNYQCSIYQIPKNYLRPYSWFKIDKLIEASKSNTGYSFWTDSDSIIVNYNYQIEQLIRPNKFLYVAKDMHDINCGVLMIKNNEFMTNFLQQVWEQTQFINHVWWEQAAIIELIKQNYMNISDYIEYVPQKIFNAYDYSYYSIRSNEGQVDSSSFIVHAPGLSLETRLQIMKKYGHKL